MLLWNFWATFVLTRCMAIVAFMDTDRGAMLPGETGLGGAAWGAAGEVCMRVVVLCRMAIVSPACTPLPCLICNEVSLATCCLVSRY